jgi:DNA-binding transcriptional LysR family regulator
MDLRRLEIFAKVAELGSFSRAAEALFLTQPTVSEHVRALEDELGLPLLDRLGRGATPTRAGQLLLDYAKRLLALGREARQAMEHFQGRMLGELVIGGSTIPGEYVLPALVGRFKRKYPDISVCLLIGSSQQVSDWAEEGRVEVGVVGARAAARSLESTSLMSDELVVVVGRDHPWAGRADVSMEELRREPMIVRERGSGSRKAFEDALAKVGLGLDGFRVVGEMGSTQAVKQGVSAGVGVSIISRRAVEDECRVRRLASLYLQGLEVSRNFYLVTHRERSRAPLAQAFLEFLEGEVGGQPV